MAEFSRIRVTPAEEEDIVIMAGAVEEVAAKPTDADGADADSSDTAAALQDEPRLQEASSRTGRSQEAYRETTLEDLQHTHMSGVQKAVIAVAIAAIVAFIIWYVLLR